MPAKGAQDRVREQVSRWEGVTVARHRYGGWEFRVGRREIGHIHGDALVDIPFPRDVRDALVASNEAEAHHVLPDSGWVSVFLHNDEDVDRAIRLLHRSFGIARVHRQRLATAAHSEVG